MTDKLPIEYYEDMLNECGKNAYVAHEDDVIWQPYVKMEDGKWYEIQSNLEMFETEVRTVAWMIRKYEFQLFFEGV